MPDGGAAMVIVVEIGGLQYKLGSGVEILMFGFGQIEIVLVLIAVPGQVLPYVTVNLIV